MRLKRNQVVSGTWHTNFSAMLLISTATRPKPLLCSNMSAALKACSSGLNLDLDLTLKFDGDSDLFFPHRTQSKRERSTPAVSAEAGSNESPASIRAQKYFCEAPARREAKTDDLPDEARLLPHNSVNPPRGMPPVTPSICAIPVGMLSCSGRRQGAKAEGISVSTKVRMAAAE